jgi:hypothetical protein
MPEQMADVRHASSPRLRRRLVAVVLVLAAGLIGFYGFVYWQSERRLREAIAEADQSDPNWRFEDLVAARKPVPDEENSALVIVATKAALPARWRHELIEADLREAVPPVLLTAEQRGSLEAVLQNADAALVQARKLIGMPRGRHPIQYKPDFVSTLLPTVQDTREVASLLALDTLRRVQNGDGKGALESCLAILNAGRSLGDEPCLICQLVREACRLEAAQAIERTLALSESPSQNLADLQRALLAEEEEPLLLYGLRGERAGIDSFIQFLLSTSDRQKYLRDIAGMSNTEPTPVQVIQLSLPGSLTSNRAAFLKYANRLVEAARLSETEQVARLAEVEASKGQQPFLLRLLHPFALNVGLRHHRGKATLRASAAALAAERYRQATGRWPETLAALVPEYLARVPADPRDGQPLRLRRFDGGIVIYSVGADDSDDGGAIDWNASGVMTPKSAQKPLDWVIRLWDAARRRQPPLLRPASPPAEKPDAKSE